MENTIQKSNIPMGWQTYSLADLGKLIMGQSPKGKSYNKEGLGLPLLNGAADLTSKGIVISQYTTEPTRKAQPGDLLFCIRATIGNLDEAEGEYCLGRGVAALRVNDKFDKQFAAKVLEKLFDLMKQRSQGGVIKGLTKDDLQNFTVIAPTSTREQEKIAKILSLVELDINKTDEIILSLEKLKKGLMQDFFTKGISNKNLQEKPLDEILSLIIDHRGLTPKKLGGEWSESGVPTISAMNVKNGKVIKPETIRFINEPLFKKWMPENIQENDILLTSEAPLGELYLVKQGEKYCLSQRLFALRPKQNVILGGFLYYFLMSPIGQSKLIERATGSTAKGIRQAELRKVVVNFPVDMDEQEEITETLFAVDVKIELYMKIKGNLILLKNGLMRDLLSGTVRVI